ncbi:hypothetical protein [Butyrivibrio sp. YAB3001]|nr:hypothetical protein [Butyrivibrio sp. YAB3001]SFC43681.1 hypothetical protein SAMN02910398_02270 [Butyrivibrio sp. YAB3001]
MSVGEIIACYTIDAVIIRAAELKKKGIITEFIENCSLRVVEVA